MKQINLGNLDITITANDTAFAVEIGNECFAETYMDQKPYRWPNPEDNDRLWGYIKGPASVLIPAPGPGKHELELLIGGRLFTHEHDFPDPNAVQEPAEEPEQPAEDPEPEQPAEHEPEQPADETEKTLSIKASIIHDLYDKIRDIAALLEVIIAAQEPQEGE